MLNHDDTNPTASDGVLTGMTMARKGLFLNYAEPTSDATLPDAVLPDPVLFEPDAAADAPAEAIDVRGQVRALMSEYKLTQTTVAAESGVHPSALSNWMRNSYTGDNAKIEATLARWIDTTQAARAQAQVLPAAPDYLPTPTSERVIAALRYAQVANDMALIYGGAGLGKTAAIREYTRRAPNVWHATVTDTSARVGACLRRIARAMGINASRASGDDLFAAICEQAEGSAGLLVIDEAQHLSTEALDQVRAIHDETGIGIALVGNVQVYARMTGGNRAPYLDRLYSRIGKQLKLTRAQRGDVDALLDGWNLRDAKTRTQLQAVAAKPGALRAITKVMRLASMHAAAESRAMTADDVRAAWGELGGDA